MTAARHAGTARPSGAVGMKIIHADGTEEVRPDLRAVPSPTQGVSLWDVVRDGLPRRGLSEEVNLWRIFNLPNLLRGARRQLLARSLRLPQVYGALYLKVLRADGTEVDYGLGSLRVVTTAGVNFLVDALQGTVEPEILRFHGIGTGTTAEASSDTALVTELTTQYNPDNTRATGTLTEGASANIFRTVGTNTVDAVVSITEHGIFSQAATGGGTLLDRSVFAALNLIIGDSLQSTYDFTVTAGG